MRNDLISTPVACHQGDQRQRESGSRNVGELLTNGRRERTTLHMVRTGAKIRNGGPYGRSCQVRTPRL